MIVTETDFASGKNIEWGCKIVEDILEIVENGQKLPEMAMK